MSNYNTPMSTQSEISEAANRNAWCWGFTPQAEIWNGRFAMIGFVSALLTEVLTNQGVLHYWGLMQPVLTSNVLLK